MRQLLNPEEQIIAKDDNQTNKSGVQSSSPQSTTGNKTNLEKSTEIQKQKRLDISQALRNMCSQTDQIQESSDLINSIIPDIGIKIEELPYELIVELNNNLNLDYEDDCPITSNSSQLCSQQHIGVSHNMEQEKNETAPNETCVKSEPIKDCNTNRLMNENAKYDNSNTLQYINVKQEYEAKSEEMSWNDETQIANILHTSDIKEETTKDGCVIKEEVVDSSIESETRSEISNNCTEISNNSVNISLPQTSTHCPETLDNNMFNKTIENVILNNGCIEDNVQNIYPRLEKEVLPTNYKNHEYIFINDTKVGIMENELNMLPIDNPPKPPAYIDVTTQTLENDTISPKKFAEEFVTNYFKQPPVDISEMVNRMFQIDECILHLTKYRQSLFKKFKKKNLQSDSDIISNSTNDRKLKKKKIFTTKRVLSRCKASKRKEIIIENSERKKSKPADLINELNFNKTDETHTVNKEVDLCETNTVAVKQQNLLRFKEIKEKVLVIKKKVIEYEDKISDNGILVLKATQEGARRVLLVGSRNSPDGKLMNKYNVGKFSGIGCLKVIKNLLFASCHNGSIYVYDMNQNVLIDSIPGPGGVILSMEVLENQVIVGTMSFNFVSIPIPLHILRQ
ncbi:hypothetical protein NQ317_013631 [Molorchus minor]|uniref:Uncharacterized protein n=1 Tax=Molorchus minor TaxID=1323400 RepID=A0ABQ9IU73_9CUCU|nr:hypothetical protein NQ317_013631 [Molorchus minor]